MADVLSRERVAEIREYAGGDGWPELEKTEEFCDSHEELRARLESAEAVLREAEAALREIEQRNSFVCEGGTARQCGICHWRYTEKGHSATCPLAALGEAGGRSGR